jgi:membrane-associated phospholipid phosphatase
MILFGRFLKYLWCLALSSSLVAQGSPANQGSGDSASKVCTDLSGQNPEPCPSLVSDEGSVPKSASSSPKRIKSQKSAAGSKRASMANSAAVPAAAAGNPEARCTDLSGNPLDACSPNAAVNQTQDLAIDQPNTSPKSATPIPTAQQSETSPPQPVSCSTVMGGSAACIAKVFTSEPALSALPPMTPQQSPGASQEPSNCTDLTGKAELNCPVPSSPTAPAIAEIKMPQERNTRLTSLPKYLFEDQKAVWTSPAHAQASDLLWITPLAGTAALLFGTDASVMTHVTNTQSHINQFTNLSNYGLYSMIAAGGGLYLLGQMKDDDHAKRAGYEAGEAAIGATAITYFLKPIAGRQRPDQGNGQGNFLSGGSSFPSEHAAISWSIASVLSHEYPKWWMQALTYGLATTVSLSRVEARQHFPSDVFVGGTLGWFMGRQVYRANHPTGAEFGQYGKFVQSQSEKVREPGLMGSPYVELDSWVYPVLERLAAMGYIQTAFPAMKPWTRMECARLVQEAGDAIKGSEPNLYVRTSYAQLAAEFAPEIARRGGAPNVGATVENIYTQITGISGTPLTDGYHFGQTIYDNFGRPYESGFNNVTGMSTYALGGPFALYVRGEYQHAPSAPVEPLPVRQTVAAIDQLPVQPGTPTAGISTFHALDAYVAMNLDNWQLSAGQESLWWGSGDDTAIMMSNNTPPIRMVRLDRTTPFKLPWLFSLLGPMRVTALIGQLQGHHFVFQTPNYSILTGSWNAFLNPQPYLHAEKLSLKLTPNLDIGVTLIAEFGGEGVPVTFRNLFRTFSTSQNPLHNSGNRQTGFQFSYKIPGLRNWLTLYTDSVSEDEPNPIAFPRRSAMAPGIYLTHIPKLPKMDFRVESAYTDLPNLLEPGIYYSDIRYRDGMTNDGYILGSWIGRQGRAVQASSNYWFAPRKTVQVGYRYMNVSPGFIPHGGTINDFYVQSSWLVGSQLSLDGRLQYEKWGFPLLNTERQSNFVTTFGMTYWPKLGKK